MYAFAPAMKKRRGRSAHSSKGILFGAGTGIAEVDALQQQIEAAWTAFNADRSAVTATAARVAFADARAVAGRMLVEAQQALADAQATMASASAIVSGLEDMIEATNAPEFHDEFDSVGLSEGDYDDGGYYY